MAKTSSKGLSQAEYDEMLARVEAGQVVEYGGRTAFSKEQLDFIADVEAGKFAPADPGDIRDMVNDLFDRASMAGTLHQPLADVTAERDKLAKQLADIAAGRDLYPPATHGDAGTAALAPVDTAPPSQAFTPEYVAQTSPPGASATAVTGDGQAASGEEGQAASGEEGQAASGEEGQAASGEEGQAASGEGEADALPVPQTALDALAAAGYGTPEALAAASDDDLLKVTGIGPATVAKIRQMAAGS